MSNFILKERDVLILAVLANILFLAFSINYYLNTLQVYGDRGWLPQPFSFYRMDIFMDYYNVNFHALTPDFYIEPFRSIYTFIFRGFSHLLIRDECKQSLSAIELRDCDGNFIIFFLIISILNFYLLIKIMNGIKNKYLWAVLFIISFPMLYAFERGNYIIVSMLIISMILLSKKEGLFYIGLVLLPLTKLYFLINFSIIFLMSIRKFIYGILLFLIIMIIGCLIYEENQFIIFKNLTAFAKKDANIFELLVATSLSPIFKYASLNFLSVILKIFYLAIIIRAYLYICKMTERDLNLNDYKYLLFILLLLTLIIIESTGFYAIILLYPFIAYFISKNILDIYEKFMIVFISVPYPLNLIDHIYQNVPFVKITIQLQSLLIPLILIVIFYKFTRNIRKYEY